MQTYDVDIIPLLVSTINDLFDQHGTKEFILSATIRNEETFQTFLDTCGESFPPLAQVLPFPLKQEKKGLHTYVLYMVYD